MVTETSASDDGKTPDALVSRLFEASLGMFDVMSVYLGDRLGLYRALDEGGPATSAGLAARAGIDERYAREWLEQQSVTGILDVDDPAGSADRRRYELPSGHRDALLDPDSPYSIAPLGRSLVACAKVMPSLVDAYRTGGGVDWSAFGPDMIEAQGDFNRPWLVNSFGTQILPAIPAIHDRLTADPPARVADVACGVGWSAIAIARAYPSVRVVGFDLDESSIELARHNAERRGVADRVTFQVADAGSLGDPGTFDLAVIIEAVHDMARPVEALAAVRRMLRPDCVALIADERTEDAFVAPGSETERMYFGFSLFACLPAVMTERPTAAIGTAIRPETMRGLALEAGFRDVARLDQPELDMLRFYLLST